MPLSRDFALIAHTYAEKVVSGEIVSCKAFKKTCARHLADLEQIPNADYPFTFSPEKAAKVCKFIELLPHTKGKWARDKTLIVLEPFQVFILACLFGWILKKSNLRRYRIAYIKLSRKNGKSLLAAGIGLYMLCADGEFGPEVYSGATTEKQAWEVFRPAQLIVKNLHALRIYYGLEAWAKSIQKPEDGGIFEPIIGKPGDGSSPSCAITDEYHEHDTSEQVDTMDTGMGAREQPLGLRITTAGYNIAGPCYDTELYAKKVLDGTLTDDAFFSAIFEADIEVDDDWTDPKAYLQANPNIDVSVNREFLDQRLLEAINNPANQTRYKTKHLNIWCSAKNAWLNMLDYRACPSDGITAWPVTAEKKTLVLDLASRMDICAAIAMAAIQVNGKWHYYLKGRFYLPERAIEDSKEMGTTYRAWVAAGHLIKHEGTEIDFERIRDDVVALMQADNISEVSHDPWRASHLAQTLDNINVQIVEYRQTVQLMSLPMKELEAAIRSKRLHHDNNPALMWMLSNVVAKTDAKDNIYPRKERAHLKIDGAVAAIMGVGRLMPKIDLFKQNPPEDWQANFA